jgi:hypothetical protein
LKSAGVSSKKQAVVGVGEMPTPIMARAKKELNEGGYRITSPTKTPRKSKVDRGTPTKPRAHPASVDQLDEDDRLVFQLKAQGKPWKEVEAHFKNVGKDIKIASTKVRYGRIKAQLSLQNFSDEDVSPSISQLVSISKALIK